MKSKALEETIRTSEKRSLQYELVDGSFELLFAVLFLLMGGILIVRVAAPRSVWSDLLAGPGFIVLFPTKSPGKRFCFSIPVRVKDHKKGVSPFKGVIILKIPVSINS